MAQTIVNMGVGRWPRPDSVGAVIGAWRPEPIGRFVTIRRVYQDEVARLARRPHRRGWPA